MPRSPVGADANPPEIIEGGTSTLSAVSTNGTVHWYTDGCGGTLVDTGNPIIVSPTETTTYYAGSFDGTCWSYACDDVTVTLNCAPPSVTSQPVGGVICAGHTHELCVAATGSGQLHYQWKRSGLALIGATSACYAAAVPGTYWCAVTDDCGPTDSETAEVVEASPASGDFDGDGDADLEDFDVFSECLTGPGNGITEGCGCADVDGNGDIDLTDFAQFQALFTG